MAFADSGLNLQLRNFGPFKDGLKQINSLVDDLNKNLILSEKIYSDLSRRVGAANRSFTTMRTNLKKSETSFKSMSDRIERQNELFLQANRGANLAGDSFDMLQVRTQKYSNDVRGLATDLIETTNRIKLFGNRSKQVNLTNLAESTDDFNDEIKRTPGLVDKASRKLKDLGTGALGVTKSLGGLATGALGLGTKAIAGFGVAAIGGLGASIKVASDNQSAFASLGKTIDGVSVVGEDGLLKLTEQGEALKETFFDLSETIPVSFAELSELAALGGQLGIVEGLDPEAANEALERFTKTVAGLGEATNIAAEDAATGLARISGIFNEELSELGIGPGENIEKLGNVIVGLGNSMATTEAEILNFSTRLAGAGATAGLSQADVFGISAAFTSVGLTAEAGATSVSRALLTMQEAIVNSDKDFIDNTDTIEKYRDKLQNLNADLVQAEQGQDGLGMSLVQQEKDWIIAGKAAEDFGRTLGDKAAEKAFQAQKDIIALQEEIERLEGIQGQPVTNEKFEELLRIIQQTEAGAKLTAESFKTLWEEDAGQAFSLFVEGLAEDGDMAAQTLEDLGLGSSEAQRAFLAMAENADLLTESITFANNEFMFGSALTDEVAQRYATLESRMTIFSNTLSNAAGKIGDVFLPAITNLVTGAGKLVGVFGDRLPEVLTALGGKFAPLFTEITGGLESVDFTQLLDSGFDLLIAAIKDFDITPIQTAFETLNTTVFPAIGEGINFVVENWDILSGTLLNVAAIGGAALAISGLATAIAFLVSPIGLAIAGVAALAVAWETNFLGIQETTNAFIADFQEGGFQAAFEGIGIPTELIESGQSFIDGFIQPIKDSIPVITESFGGLGESLGALFNNKAMQFLIGGAMEAGGGLGDWLAENSASIGEFVGVVVTTPLEQIAGFVDVISAFLDVLSSGATTESITALVTAFGDLLTLPFDNFGAFFTGDEDFDIVESIGASLTGLGESITPILTEQKEIITKSFDAILSSIDLGLPTFPDSTEFLTEVSAVGTKIKNRFANLLTTVDLGFPTFPDIAAKADEIKQSIIDTFTGLFDGIDLGLPELPSLGDIDLTPDFLFGEDTTDAEALGKSQQEGIAKGIEDNKDEPKGAIEAASDYLSDTWTSYWDSESPSGVTEGFGVDLMAGWALGLGQDGEVITALGNFNQNLMTIFQTAIPQARSTTDEFTNVTLGELVSMFNILSGETIPQYAAALLDEAIPATDMMTDSVNNLISTLGELLSKISEVAAALEGQLSQALQAISKLMKLTNVDANKLGIVIEKLAKQYLALAAAITAANNAGSGLSPAPAGPSTGGGAPAFQSGGSFVVPKSIPLSAKGPTGGMLIEVHKGERVDIIPENEVASLPISGAGITNNITDNSVGNTRGGDTFVLNLPAPVGGQADVISNFRLMETLAKG